MTYPAFSMDEWRRLCSGDLWNLHHAFLLQRPKRGKFWPWTRFLLASSYKTGIHGT